MAATAAPVLILRFGAFELDLRAAELRRAGLLIRLAPQQYTLLRFLAEHPAQICSREQLRVELWGEVTFVDFDRGLNVAVAGLRAALNDDSESPRFIQTVPRQGYRFVAPVETVTAPGPAPVPAPPRPSWLAALALMIAVALSAYWLLRPARPTMVAVVPLENLTGHPESASLASGLTDELLTQLGAIDPVRLGVIGRTSVARYAASKPTLAEIRRDLGVDYIVEGSVRAEDTTIRISLRLLQAAPQSQVWSQIWQVEPRAQLETEQDIAVTASVAIAARLAPANQPPRARPHSPPPAAHDAWLSGRYLQGNRNREDTARAIAFFERATVLDPAGPAPWTSIAESRLGVALSGGPAAESFAAARAAAARALQLDPNIAETHNVLANVCFWNDWNRLEARTHFERALALNPSLARAHHDYALFEIVTGHAEAGVTSLRRALALDPLSPQVNIDAGWLFLQAHHFDEALRYARRALELEPTLEEAQRCVARALLYQGKADAETLARLRRMATESANPYNRALVAAATGQAEAAFDGLAQALQQHSHLLVMISTEPAFNRLHADPRYQRIAARVGF